MKIFLTGATGVLGRRVITNLLEAGHELSALSRSVQNYQELEAANVKPVWGNLFDPDEMIKITHGQEVIIHLASNVPVASPKLKRDDWLENDKLREQGTENLARAGLKNGVKLFLAPGVMLAYGDQQGKWVTEKTPLSSQLPADLLSAVRMEEMVQQYVRKHGLPAVVIRLGILYSEDSAHTLDLIQQLRNGTASIVGKGNSYLNLIHPEDAASAIASIVARYNVHIGAVNNICDGEPVTAKEYVDFMAKKMGATPARSRHSLSAWMTMGRDQLKVTQISFRAKNEAARQKLKWSPSFRNYSEGLTSIAKRLSGRWDKNAA